MINYHFFLMNKKDNYDIGDFIVIEEGENNDNKVGIVVKKILRSELDRVVYWFKHDYEYLVSLKQYSGDYSVVEYTDIIGIKKAPIEYKLSYISQFGDWWYGTHKSLYQSLLIAAIQ